MPNFNSLQGELTDIFVSDFELVDRYVGNQLWIWGYNFLGSIGDNTIIGRSSPVQTISGGTNWKQVSGGYSFTAAIKTDGTLWTWGYNDRGQLGTNNLTHRSSPVQTVAGGTNWKQLSLGQAFVSAIKTDGTLWSWGDNSYGQLGDNTTTNKSSPVQTISAGTNWKQVSCGYYHTAAIKTDGTLWLWGSNDWGELGNNTSGALNRKSSPVQTISAGTNWKQVSCGSVISGAIKTDGTLWVWGNNDYGKLGVNDTSSHRSSPVQTVAGGTNWKQVSFGYYHTAAIKTDGTLWLWGKNDRGELGTNNVTNRSSPVQTITAGTNWKQVEPCKNESEFTTAIKTDGTLWVWGDNTYGQLGTNNVNHYSSPVQTSLGGTNWKQVAASGFQTMAVTFTEF